MLELKNISFEVTEENESKQIVKDLSLTLEDGKFIVITGPNGGGKSTLARVIAGINMPTSGKIFFEGVDITDKSITERAKMGIGYGFQQPVRFKGITVHDLICLAAGKDLKVTEVCEYLAEVACAPGITSTGKSMPASLAGN